jgi:hypothetical protein
MAKDEFAGMQGNVQQQGSGTRIMALARAALVPGRPSEAPKVDIDDRQVLSTFDTRPIDAYDFAAAGTGATPGNVATQEFFMGGPIKSGLAANMCQISFPIPVGFVAVIKRIEFTVMPAHNTSGIGTPMQVLVNRSDSAIPDNDVKLWGITESYGWDTHQVFGYWEVPGLTFTFHDLVDHGVGARILGTLIPARNAAPHREIGSLPLSIRK